MERGHPDDESSQRDSRLQILIEKCKEQYKAIEITEGLIEVRSIHTPGPIRIACFPYLFKLILFKMLKIETGGSKQVISAWLLDSAHSGYKCLLLFRKYQH